MGTLIIGNIESSLLKQRSLKLIKDLRVTDFILTLLERTERKQKFWKVISFSTKLRKVQRDLI